MWSSALYMYRYFWKFDRLLSSAWSAYMQPVHAAAREVMEHLLSLWRLQQRNILSDCCWSFRSPSLRLDVILYCRFFTSFSVLIENKSGMRFGFPRYQWSQHVSATFKPIQGRSPAITEGRERIVVASWKRQIYLQMLTIDDID
ncbi:hypothetical protein QG37_07771 [Candidozyma auris]|nr:hypothetical protein QG37_07771 [[Candida] auris]